MLYCNYMTYLYKTDAILLNAKNRGERDKLLSFYSRHFGQINILGKSLRTTASKLSSNLTLFSRLNLGFVSKKSGQNSNGATWLLTEAIEINPFLNIKKNDQKFLLAGRWSLFLERFLRGPQEDIRLWELILGGFKFLDKENLNEKEIEALDLVFKLRILRELGYLNEEEINLPIFNNEWRSFPQEKKFLAEIVKNLGNHQKILNQSIIHSHL